MLVSGSGWVVVAGNASIESEPTRDEEEAATGRKHQVVRGEALDLRVCTLYDDEGGSHTEWEGLGTHSAIVAKAAIASQSLAKHQDEVRPRD